MPDRRVIIDGRPLTGERTGIGVHVAEITARLGDGIVPVIASHREIRERESLGTCRFVVDQAPTGVWWQQRMLPLIALRENGDVVWGPHGTLPWNLRTPSVVTMHDLTSITMPHRHRLKTVLSFNLFITRSLEIATRITAVSIRTADELVRGFGVPASKIAVIPNGVSDFFCPDPADRTVPPQLRDRPYILYVGTLEPRKGIGDLIDAWETLPAGRPALVLAGSRGWGNRRIMARAAAGIERGDVLLAGFVNRDQLRALYRRTSLFVYPSHYEGFGLPPLEAMACGAPVIATRAGAIPEVLDDAARLVDPGDPASLAAAIRQVLAERSLRDAMIEAGLSQAARFRWERSAALMREELEAAAGS